MPVFFHLSIIVDLPFAVGRRRYECDAAAILDVTSDRVAVVGHGKQEASAHKPSYGMNRSGTVILVPAGKAHAQAKSGQVHGSGDFDVAAALRLPRFLAFWGRRMLRGVLMSFHTRGVVHYGDREVAVSTGDAFEIPRPHPASAPSAKKSPHTVVFFEPTGEVVSNGVAN